MARSSRRTFIKHTLTASIGMGIPGATNYLLDKMPGKGGKIGMIGLDTGHSPAFVKSLNSATNGEYDHFKVVAAYPPGTDNILKWKKRIPEFTAQVKEHGVEIVHSIPDLLRIVDYIILTTIDGNKHLEQAKPVFEAGLPVFIDKPFAGSIEDARKIAKLAETHGTPMFSSSSLRFMEGAEEVRNGSLGKVNGVQAYSPAHIEPTHPDLFWYGVHGVELLFTLMGTGCQWVERTYTADTDLVTGMWKGNRIGTFRGIRDGKGGYGAMVFADNEIKYLNKFNGYTGLLHEVVKFFKTNEPPVEIDETLEIFTFMEAAERSKEMDGQRVFLNSI